ncbi:hypothetical protein PIROE2DRAFT_2846 [Piromyces sp. E2]|nr:hypothetical protein PIROE2DRAFT_2846 [Piromyces sp. E2]|eukprot:OUM69336.1 hypothetical protein PIROE2DRAFT_2846 [Piromyces sp. E2]
MYEEYLKESEFIDYESEDDIDLVRRAFYFVRDEIRHSADVIDRRVTVTASECLRERVGICWVKSNLLAALLRANGIPSGISHQRITIGHKPNTGFCIHALNTVYVPSLKKWIRLDARGNNSIVHTEFSLDKEILAYPISFVGEKDYFDNSAEPDPGLMKVLKENTDALYMYILCLPDRLAYEY